MSQVLEAEPSRLTEWGDGLVRLGWFGWDSLHKLEPKLCMRSALLSCSTIPQSHTSMHKNEMRACPPESWIMRKNTFRRAQGAQHYSCLHCKAGKRCQRERSREGNAPASREQATTALFPGLGTAASCSQAGCIPPCQIDPELMAHPGQ